MYTRLTTALVLALFITACGGGRNGEPPTNVLAAAPADSVVQPGNVLPGATSDSPPAGVPDQRSVAEAPVPDGVDPGVFELLRTELLRILDERSVDSRQASFTPYGTANQIDDLTLTGSGPYRLTWTYRNIGDYDFNGQVNVSDLTPIGVYFGMSESDPLWPLACTADGDGNGLITVSDITPLGQNFGGTIVGYQVWGTDQREGEWNFLGNATVETNLRKNALRPRFVIQLSTLDYTYLGLWPYDNSDDEGWWSNTATLGQSEPRYIVGMRSIWDAGS